MADLVLYSRVGCCLCEGLEERLRALEPSPALLVVDVDGDPELQARFSLEVPLLARPALAGPAAPPRLLPRVPPRLAGAALQRWLERHP
jgi:hypothetical protein